MSHPLQLLGSLPMPSTDTLPITMPLSEYLSEFLSNHPVLLEGVRLQQFKRVLLSTLNQEYVTAMFYYLLHEYSKSLQRKAKVLETYLREKYVSLFQSIRQDKSIISHAVMICDVRIVFQIYSRMLRQMQTEQTHPKISKNDVYQGIQKITKIELGVDVTLASVQLMVKRLFKRAKNSTLSTSETVQKQTQEVQRSPSVQKLLPQVKEPLPQLKSRTKSLNLLRKDTFEEGAIDTSKHRRGSSQLLPSFKSRIHLNKANYKKPYVLEPVKLSHRRIKTQILEEGNNKPYYRLHTQMPQILKYKKVDLYREVAQMANKVQYQYQYQSPMKVLANNSMGMKMLNQLFSHSRKKTIEIKKVQQNKGLKQEEDGAVVVGLLENKASIIPEYKKKEKTQEEVFEQELRRGKYKNRSKQYRNEYKDLL